MTVKIKILVEGIYNDDQRSAKTLKPGDVSETYYWYADSLIESGYAERLPGQTDSTPEVMLDDQPGEVSIADAKNMTEVSKRTRAKKVIK